MKDNLIVGTCAIMAIMLAGIGVINMLTPKSHTEKLQQKRKTALEKYKDQMEM